MKGRENHIVPKYSVECPVTFEFIICLHDNSNLIYVYDAFEIEKFMQSILLMTFRVYGLVTILIAAIDMSFASPGKEIM